MNDGTPFFLLTLGAACSAPPARLCAVCIRRAPLRWLHLPAAAGLAQLAGHRDRGADSAPDQSALDSLHAPLRLSRPRRAPLPRAGEEVRQGRAVVRPVCPCRMRGRELRHRVRALRDRRVLEYLEFFRWRRRTALRSGCRGWAATRHDPVRAAGEGCPRPRLSHLTKAACQTPRCAARAVVFAVHRGTADVGLQIDPGG